MFISAVQLQGQTTGNWLDATGNATNARTFTTSKIGLNATHPDGWQEIRYCPPANQDSKGLVITRENCMPNSSGAGQSFISENEFGFLIPISIDSDYPFLAPVQGTEPGSPITTWAQGVKTLGPIPFSYYSPVGSSTVAPSVNFFNGMEPLVVARTVDFPNPPSLGSYKSRFMVMPNGNSGFNTESPRAALDVQNSNIPNRPIAIFGNVVPASLTNLPNFMPTVGAPIAQTYTRGISIVPRLKATGYNPISKAEDIGLFFTDGMGTDGSNANGSFVLAPFSTSPTSTGLRMSPNGDIEFTANNLTISGDLEIRGAMRCNGFKSEPKWWPDFVFEKEYKLMSLDSVNRFITQHHHLPGMPSRATILAEGQDIGYIQQLQQQKIEELTLYNIELLKRLEGLEAFIEQFVKK
jgi:hypothetical protein